MPVKEDVSILKGSVWKKKKKRRGRKFICGPRTQKTNWGSVVLMCRGQQQTHAGFWLTTTWVAWSLALCERVSCSPTIKPQAMKPPIYSGNNPPNPVAELKLHPTSARLCGCLCVTHLSPFIGPPCPSCTELLYSIFPHLQEITQTGFYAWAYEASETKTWGVALTTF